ncbi:hypothetical protein [Luteibacter yeojuensis]|uniref:Uncharacterized protein n=1 Tax=Luteibacter yeojuensis TaxID=345309 RepID=A0A7X5QT66_9GAMM|nr:hypothetical protein [Luteibacter yeojuensis]NID14976.1 hypothetical protein [Luteibacter yeojuensis]
MTWLLSLLRSGKDWALAILATLAAAGAAYFFGRRSGSSEATANAQLQQRADQAETTAAAAQAAVHNAEVRHDVESETAALPDAPPSSVAAAPAGTAAGRLRDDGWTRD